MKGLFVLIIAVMLAASALGLYSLFDSEEVHRATGEAIEDIGEGLRFVLIGVAIAIAVGVCLLCVGWATSQGAPPLERGMTQRHLIDTMSESGVLREPYGDHWAVFAPRNDVPSLADQHRQRYLGVERGEHEQER